MRDIFENIFTLPVSDPVEAARKAARPVLRKRFYQQAGIQPVKEGFSVVLDGRPVRTPARRSLTAPSAALGEALAAEWNSQAEVIDPATMPLTRLANSIIDGVAEAGGPVTAEIGRYLASDLLFYRADRPERLADRQAILWDPILAWMREEAGARFVLTEGVMHVSQPEAAVAAVGALIPEDIWRLGAVHAITTLTGSALLALAILHGRLTVEEAWTAAHVDEDFNIEQWGEDALASERRAFREAEMRAAGRLLECR